MLFLKDKAKEESLVIFKVYVPSDKKYFTYSTGIKVKVSDWNFSTNSLIQKRGEAGKEIARNTAVLNNYTTFYQYLLNDINLVLTKDLLKKKFDEKFKGGIISNDFLYPTDLFDQFIKEKETLGLVSSNTINYYNVHIKVFKEFENITRKYKYEDINKDLFPIYLKYLRDKKGYKDSTLHKHFEMLRLFWEWAFKKANRIKLFDSFKYKNREPDKIALSEADLEKLYNLKLEDKKLQEARDVFLIGCYSGQRFSDYSIFEKADIRNGMLVKLSEKTEIQAYIPLHKKLKSILEKYNYKIPKFKYIQEFNDLIREVCRKAKFYEKIKIVEYRGNEKDVKIFQRWELISSHTARRSFITISTMKGMPDKVIMNITGIKEVSTLFKYKKISVTDIKKAIKVWE